MKNHSGRILSQCRPLGISHIKTTTNEDQPSVGKLKMYDQQFNMSETWRKPKQNRRLELHKN